MNRGLLLASRGAALGVRSMLFFFGISNWGERHPILNSFIPSATSMALCLGGVILLQNPTLLHQIWKWTPLSIFISFFGLMMIFLGFFIALDMLLDHRQNQLLPPNSITSKTEGWHEDI